jgi:uncharacterized integral membrane protein
MRYLFWAVTLLVAILGATFAVSNRQPVGIDFWPLPIAVEAPLFLIILALLALGFAAGWVVAWLRGLRPRRERRGSSA